MENCAYLRKNPGYAPVIEPFFPGCSNREDLMPLVKIIAAAAMGKSDKSQFCFTFSCGVISNLSIIDPS